MLLAFLKYRLETVTVHDLIDIRMHIKRVTARHLSVPKQQLSRDGIEVFVTSMSRDDISDSDLILIIFQGWSEEYATFDCEEAARRIAEELRGVVTRGRPRVTVWISLSDVGFHSTGT